MRLGAMQELLEVMIMRRLKIEASELRESSLESKWSMSQVREMGAES